MTAVSGIKGFVHAAIERASQATGVDFGFLMKTANRESGFNPTAKAGTSSAAGLFQFVEQTWLATLKAHGGKYGYGQYAALIGQNSDGRYYVQGDARRAVMDLRFDAQAASLLTASSSICRNSASSPSRVNWSGQGSTPPNRPSVSVADRGR